MKFTPLARATLLAFALTATLTSARADLTIYDPGYQATSFHTSTDSNDILSYDWDNSGNLYYDTSTPGFNFGGLYSYNGSSTSTLTPGTSDYSGASVVAIGGSVYFNNTDASTFDNNIYQYSIAGGTVSFVSNTANYALFKGPDNSMFLTGAPGFGTNHIYHTGLNVDGTFVSDPATDLGVDSGSPGPLTFDASGNLYYAPGLGDESIYKWTATQVKTAIDSLGTSPLDLAGADVWATYSSPEAGGTSMLIFNDQLLLTLTDFGAPSDLVSFGINTDGTYNGNFNFILSDTGTITSLGELRVNNGSLFLSDGTQIYDIQTVPEPSTIFLVVLGMVALVWFYARRARRLAPAAVLTATTVFFSLSPAHAGPFSPAADQSGSTGIAASDPNIAEWANNVVNLTRGPVNITSPAGAKTTFGTAANALGASDSTQSNPNNVVSLGDGGSITLSFAQPITNGTGADFAVYENGFPQAGVPNSYFLELATVAVSSDGANFFTFPSVSLTQTGTQVVSFGTLDPTNLYNLAGSEIVGYGTPFNLDDLAGVSPLLNLNDVTQVRVTDVIGNINTGLGAGTYASDDATNPIFHGLYGTSDHLINDPYSTPFNSGGFDLDAIGVLNAIPEPASLWYLVPGLAVLTVLPRCLRPPQLGA